MKIPPTSFVSHPHLTCDLFSCTSSTIEDIEDEISLSETVISYLSTLPDHANAFDAGPGGRNKLEKVDKKHRYAYFSYVIMIAPKSFHWRFMLIA